MNAVVFGAGAVGLGFLGELLTRSGYRPIFVDIDTSLVAALDSHGEYVFHKVGEDTERVRVTGIAAASLQYPQGRAQLVASLGKAQAVFTAAGSEALPAIGGALADALRATRLTRCRLNVFCCENHRDAAEALRQATEKALVEGAELIDKLGFVNTVVARMCQRLTTTERDLSPVTPDSDTVIVAEDFDLFPVEGEVTAEPRPHFRGVKYLCAEEFEAWEKRKTFAHNGVHALLAVLGKLKGYRYLYEAGQDSEIDGIARGAMWEEVGPALVKAHPQWLSTADQDAFAHDLYARLVSRSFGDTIERGVRGSMRMVSAQDGRLIRAARFVAEQGITPYRLCLGAAGVLHLNDISRGDVAAISRAADHELSENIVELVVGAYDAISQWGTGEADRLGLWGHPT